MQNAPNEPEAPAPKKPRRRFTEEERIAMRKAEIAAIEARQRDRVRERIEEEIVELKAIHELAATAGMEDERLRISAAIAALANAALAKD